MDYEETKKKYWAGIIARALERADGDPRELLKDLKDGALLEIINSRSIKYTREVAAAWREVIERFEEGEQEVT